MLVYSKVGNMIQAESDPQKRDEYLQRLMELPNKVSSSFFFLIYIKKFTWITCYWVIRCILQVLIPD